MPHQWLVFTRNSPPTAVMRASERSVAVLTPVKDRILLPTRVGLHEGGDSQALRLYNRDDVVEAQTRLLQLLQSIPPLIQALER